MQRGKFIVIEGGDGSGKTTQAALLLDALKKQGVAATRIKFPRKELFFGAFVYDCLDGKYGDFLALDPHFAALPYALDQSTAKAHLVEMLERGHVIADRYSPSNLAHQAAKLSGENDQRALIDYVEKVTYDELGALRPDLVVYLDVPADISSQLSSAQGKYDQHEADRSYQKRVREVYRMLARERDDWRMIDCAKNGQLRSKEEIHENIFLTIDHIFSINIDK